MPVKIEIIKSRGNYEAGAKLQVDEQIARQLVSDGLARVIQPLAADARVTTAAPVAKTVEAKTKKRRK